jgi:heptaprenyl diphosphate synthase
MIRNDKTEENINKIRYDTAIQLAQREVEDILSKSPIIIRKYTNHLTSSQGKYIRAKSLLLSAEDKLGFIHPNAITMASAIEILHLATLVHDDVIDDAKLRRGMITLQKKYDKKTAVICGDYLLCAALKMAASISDKQDYHSMNLPDYMSKICLGELNQHINNGNINLTIFQYMKIISGKTAALFEASFYAGAYFAGNDQIQQKTYRKIGYLLGMIFQLTDDCIDFESSEEEALKPVQSDYEQGVITLPLIHTFDQRKDLKERAFNNQLARDEINQAVHTSGGLVFAKMVVQRYYKKAQRLIQTLDETDEKKGKLIAMLDKVSRITR